jgi:oligopeptidase B
MTSEPATRPAAERAADALRAGGARAGGSIPAPPPPERRTTSVERFGRTFVDHYGWMRDAEDPATLAWLEANNAHTDDALGHLEDLRKTIYDEIKGRVVETDTTAGVIEDDWVYYSRTVAGSDYGIHCRRPTTGDRHADVAPVPPDVVPPGEQVLLDENVEAEGHDYLGIGGFAVSPDHRLLAWLVDVTGRELYELRIRDLATGEDTVVVDRATYGLAWSNDSTRLYWLEPDETQRPHRVWRHAVGGPGGPDHDVMVLAEDDARFWMSVGAHRSEHFVEVSIGSSTTSEVWLLDADDPDAAPWVVAPRRSGIEYHVEHDRARDRLLVATNDGADDFRLLAAPLAGRGGVAAQADWREVLGHRPGVRLEDVDAFVGALFVTERTAARVQVRILDPTDPHVPDRDTGVLAWPEEVHTAGITGNPVDDTEWYRFAFTSLTQPGSLVELRLSGPGLRPAGDEDRVVVRTHPVPGYDPDRYTSRRDWAVAPDGTRIPVSIVARADLGPGPHPTLLYGYGAYEISLDPMFSPSRVSQLDRGMVVAFAHVRGGGEMGRGWYLDGKFANKPNSFTDFVAVADHLVATGTTSSDRLVIEGGSAGGLLVGAVVNERPDLATAVVAAVPFVDVLATMSDPSLPLTVGEYEEWGNPLEQEWFDVIAAYSPYDNVTAQPYPAMLVTAGLNDPRVGYWEPAKWVARLRDHTTSDAPILLKTQLGAGHAGPSGRYSAWEERAFHLAFMLDRVGATELLDAGEG